MQTCNKALALLATTGVLIFVTTCANAHVTLDQPQVESGTNYKAVIRIGHGCEGTATHTVTVQIPSGYRGVKPMPKAGWTLTTRKAALAEPYDSHGKRVTEDVVEVSWKASSVEARLHDTWYDEFFLRGQIVAAAGPMWFKIKQLCEKGEWDWSDVPAKGISTKGLNAPAALLEVLPAASSMHHH